MKDERLIEAFNAWEELSQTPDTIIAYQSRLKTIIDEEAKLDYAEYKGIEKGREEGIKEGIKEGLEQGKKAQAIETAKILIAQSIPDEVIRQSTQLTMEEINALKSDQ